MFLQTDLVYPDLPLGYKPVIWVLQYFTLPNICTKYVLRLYEPMKRILILNMSNKNWSQRKINSVKYLEINNSSGRGKQT